MVKNIFNRFQLCFQFIYHYYHDWPFIKIICLAKDYGINFHIKVVKENQPL